MKTIVIDRKSLKYNQNNIVNIQAEIFKKTIIRGTVYTNEGKSYADAVVELIEKNPSTGDHRVLGVVTTDKYGEYYFVVIPKYCMVYEINVFPMLCEGDVHDYR